MGQRGNRFSPRWVWRLRQLRGRSCRRPPLKKQARAHLHAQEQRPRVWLRAHSLRVTARRWPQRTRWRCPSKQVSESWCREALRGLGSVLRAASPATRWLAWVPFRPHDQISEWWHDRGILLRPRWRDRDGSGGGNEGKVRLFVFRFCRGAPPQPFRDLEASGSGHAP